MIPTEIAIIFLGSIAAGTTYTAYLYHKDLQRIRKNMTCKATSELKFLTKLSTLVKLMALHPREEIRDLGVSIESLCKTYSADMRATVLLNKGEE